MDSWLILERIEGPRLINTFGGSVEIAKRISRVIKMSCVAFPLDLLGVRVSWTLMKGYEVEGDSRKASPIEPRLSSDSRGYIACRSIRAACCSSTSSSRVDGVVMPTKSKEEGDSYLYKARHGMSDNLGGRRIFGGYLVLYQSETRGKGNMRLVGY